MYDRNRYYSPESGQFTQSDPIGLAGGMNSYGFANGDPVNSSDPFGLCPKNAGGDGKTETFTDCVSGSGYYANEAANGRGGFLNDVKGVAATFAESYFGPGECGTKYLCGTVPDFGGPAGESAFTAKQLAKFEGQLSEHGLGSLLKSQRTIRGNLAEHLERIERYRAAGGFTSSMETEIHNYRRELAAIESILRRLVP